MFTTLNFYMILLIMIAKSLHSLVKYFCNKKYYVITGPESQFPTRLLYYCIGLFPFTIMQWFSGQSKTFIYDFIW